MKHFILFLVYTWLASVLALLIFGWNYFLCAEEDCAFTPVLIQLVRVLTVCLFFTLLFTSSMIMNVMYGTMTGVGTIDRLKRKANDTVLESDEEPIPLKDIFGIAGCHSWFFPVDPIFQDYDTVMGFSTMQRLLREQMLESTNEHASRYTNGVRETYSSSVYTNEVRDIYSSSVASKEYIPV